MEKITLDNIKTYQGGEYDNKESGIHFYNNHYANWKQYNIPKAQLIIADLPYQLGDSAYASNPAWYNDGDNSNGESDKAKSSFFKTEDTFKIPEFFHFCSTLLKPEPKVNTGKDLGEGGKKTGGAPCMIIFCAFEQQWEIIEEARKAGFKHYINLVFRKNWSAQVLKANMRVVGNCEYGLILYRERLPKFNNDGQMIFNCMEFPRDTDTPKVHPTQKPVRLLENLIRIFSDEGDVVIDPVAGSGTTLLAASNMGRRAYGFEVEKKFFKEACTKVLVSTQRALF
jgi:site-specific DNA-methyltransferase (adenine-specific)